MASMVGYLVDSGFFAQRSLPTISIDCKDLSIRLITGVLMPDCSHDSSVHNISFPVLSLVKVLLKISITINNYTIYNGS